MDLLPAVGTFVGEYERPMRDLAILSTKYARHCIEEKGVDVSPCLVDVVFFVVMISMLFLLVFPFMSPQT